MFTRRGLVKLGVLASTAVAASSIWHSSASMPFPTVAEDNATTKGSAVAWIPARLRSAVGIVCRDDKASDKERALALDRLASAYDAAMSRWMVAEYDLRAGKLPGGSALPVRGKAETSSAYALRLAVACGHQDNRIAAWELESASREAVETGLALALAVAPGSAKWIDTDRSPGLYARMTDARPLDNLASILDAWFIATALCAVTVARLNSNAGEQLRRSFDWPTIIRITALNDATSSAFVKQLPALYNAYHAVLGGPFDAPCVRAVFGDTDSALHAWLHGTGPSATGHVPTATPASQRQ